MPPHIRTTAHAVDPATFGGVALHYWSPAAILTGHFGEPCSLAKSPFPGPA